VFNELMDRYFQERQHRLALIHSDIDHFKSVNDRYGPPEGRRRLAAHCADRCADRGERAVVCRWGGEEFAVLISKTAPNPQRRPVT
jgi:diguanylate cyclase (GGDEF)-like protein